jgi:hypothetical protein
MVDPALLNNNFETQWIQIWTRLRVADFRTSATVIAKVRTKIADGHFWYLLAVGSYFLKVAYLSNVLRCGCAIPQ